MVTACAAELCPYWPGEGCLRGVLPCDETDPLADGQCQECGAVFPRDHKTGCGWLDLEWEPAEKRRPSW